MTPKFVLISTFAGLACLLAPVCKADGGFNAGDPYKPEFHQLNLLRCLLHDPYCGYQNNNTITAFTFRAADNPSLSADFVGPINGHLIGSAMPSGANLTSMIPTIAISGKSISPAGGVPRDFSSPVTYTVTADDGSSQAYVVTVTSCPAGYVSVPANATVGTTSDFCAAKYEMKITGQANGAQTYSAAFVPESRSSGTAWVNIHQDNARTECASLGTGYHLITNEEWMTIARNIETTAVNWSTGVVNSGTLNTGHSDNGPPNALAASTDNDPCSGTGQTCSDVLWHAQRRTHVLSNSEVLWDISGDVYDLTDWNVLNDKVNPQAASIELNIQTPTTAMPATSFKSTNTALTAAANSIGAYYPNLDGTGGAGSRGGHWNNGVDTGVFYLTFSFGPTTLLNYMGFRCVYSP